MTILAQLNTSSFVPSVDSSVLEDERRAAWDRCGMQIADYKLKSALEPGPEVMGGDVGAYFILENLNSNPTKCTRRRVRCAAYIYMYMLI